MAFLDKDFISKEKHELDYVLRKWDKRTTQENRDILIKALDSFNADPTLEPHTRPLFYKFAEDTGLLATLASKKAGDAEDKGATEKPAGTGAEPKPKGKFRWWWILIAVLILILIFLLLRTCSGCSSPNARAGDGTTANAATTTAEAPVAAPAAPTTAEASSTTTLEAQAGQTAQAAQAALEKRVLSLEALPSEALTIRFLPDSSTELAGGEAAKLAVLIAALKGFDSGTLVVTGHAASVGYAEGEKLVSEERARFIARKLAEAGISADIAVTTSGRGASEMIQGAELEAARAASRRAVISAK